MVDIAIVFHWPPDCMEAMELPELLLWHALAVERHNRLNSPPDRT